MKKPLTSLVRRLPQRAAKEAGERRDQVREALGRDLEAARCAVDRASGSMMPPIPPRLVAGSRSALEQGAGYSRGGRIVARRSSTCAAIDPPMACKPGLRTVWSAPTSDARLKRIVRNHPGSWPDIGDG